MKQKNDRYHSLIWLTAILATAETVWSQEPSLFEASYEPPRTTFGHPDLQGVWSNAMLTPLERPREFADQAFLT